MAKTFIVAVLVTQAFFVALSFGASTWTTFPAGKARFFGWFDAGDENWGGGVWVVPDAAGAAFMNKYWYRTVSYQTYFDSKLSVYKDKSWAYKDLTAIYKDSDLAKQHPEWIMKDVAGNKLYIDWACSGGSCPQYMADFTNPALMDYWIQDARAIFTTGYSGIFMDDTNLEMRTSNGVTPTRPKDPRTGAAMTDDAYMEYMAIFTERVRAAFPDKELCHNSIWFAGGALQYDNPNVMREISSATAINMERGYGDSGLTGGTGHWSLYNYWRFIDKVHSLGKFVYMLHNSDSLPDTAPFKEYYIACYFMVNMGNDAIEFTGMTKPNWETRFSDINLGDATVPRYSWNGLWRRDFTHGVVLVNEPGASQKTVAVPAGGKDIDGGDVSTVTLPQRGGKVIYYATGVPGDPPQPPPQLPPNPPPPPTLPPHTPPTKPPTKPPGGQTPPTKPPVGGSVKMTPMKLKSTTYVTSVNKERTHFKQSKAKWSAALAKAALSVAKTCSYHRPAGTTVAKFNGAAAKVSIKSWTAEKKNVSCKKNKKPVCKAKKTCDSYFQMVYSSSKTFGCAAVRCLHDPRSPFGAGGSWTFFVCKYKKALGKGKAPFAKCH